MPQKGRIPSMPVWLALIALSFSGAVQALISPPVNLWWIHPIALAPGFYVLLSLSGRRAFYAGWLMGLCANLGIFSWLPTTLTTFAEFHWVLSTSLSFGFCAVYAIYLGVFAWGIQHIKSVCGSFQLPALALWFVTCEFLNPQFFPYYQGVAWYQLPSVFLVSAYAGVPAVSFLVVLSNLVIASFARSSRLPQGEPWAAQRLLSQIPVGTATLLVGLGLAFLLSEARQQEIEEVERGAPPLQVGLVQANIDVERGWAIKKDSLKGTARAHVELARRSLQKHPDTDVFVFPEGALSARPDARGLEFLQDFARDAEVEVWTGSTARRSSNGRIRSFNSAWQLLSDGRAEGPYDKIHLLPFGEFVPGRESFPSLRKYQFGGDVTPGQEQRIFTSSSGIRFCFLICYEITLPQSVQEVGALAPELLVNLTYDAWFGDSACLSQHLMLASIASAQLGTPLVRVATTGISAVTDARGVLLSQTEPWTETVLVQKLRVAHVPSLYGRWGNWFGWGSVFIALGILFWALLRRRRMSEL